jgi:hypothetical protein
LPFFGQLSESLHLAAAVLAWEVRTDGPSGHTTAADLRLENKRAAWVQGRQGRPRSLAVNLIAR